MVPLRIGTDRNAVVPGMQKISYDSKMTYGTSYFDGEKLFLAESYYKLYSRYRDHYEWIDWTQGILHGQCEKLIILGKYLYIDFDVSDYVDRQYEACAWQIGRCVREKMWFKRWYY